jgi:hypothetical protein
MAAPAFDALINTANPNAAEDVNVDITAECINANVPIPNKKPPRNSIVSAAGTDV